MRWFLVSCLLSFCAVASASITIQGTVYDYDFKPVPAVLRVNTTPEQTFVSPDGHYRLEVEPGIYRLTAVSGLNYSSSEVIEAKDAGTYELDLMIEERIGDERAYEPPPVAAREISPTLPPRRVGSSAADYALPFAALALLAIAAVAVWLYFGRRQAGNAPSRGPPASQHPSGHQFQTVSHPPMLPPSNERSASVVAGEREIMGVIEHEGGGIITQKELRKKLPEWSEARVSMLLTSLEAQGRIRTMKQGRGNIIRKA